MTTCEQSKNSGVGDAGGKVPASSVSPEARVEKLGQLFNTLGRFFPVASAPEWGELFNKQEMMEKAKQIAARSRRRGRETRAERGTLEEVRGRREAPYHGPKTARIKMAIENQAYGEG